MHWKRQMLEKAYRIAEPFCSHTGVAGVALGGSIGRGQMWKHSDLELCLVVERRIEELQHFNYMDSMGVEIIQITKSRMKEFTEQSGEPDRSILGFPIQIYKCKILHDPEQLLNAFKKRYDSYLFHEHSTKFKEKEALKQADAKLDKAREQVARGNYRTAAAHLRVGLNFLLLAVYWHHHILPRSQNRTIYFLHKNSQVIGNTKLYDAFIQVFGLENPRKTHKDALQNAQRDIFQLSDTSWGSNTSAFLKNAVDGNLEWGHHQSIVYVYKYCVHRMHGHESYPEDFYDRPDFARQFPELYHFLDMDTMTLDDVKQWILMFEEARGDLQPHAV
ncbi:nucleotidyltransferase domain-containing protein [Paenibacillus sp. 32352]|uniref:nucleotidyltransferase domain-containing protein n=1 Tax=Paenibacillus sp. 32352 TaxID=1969111 RepID=UPI00117E6648|nr:nucleotidyltransferase domain-containing protein [Paenibacillus sp. 32352]